MRRPSPRSSAPPPAPPHRSRRAPAARRTRNRARHCPGRRPGSARRSREQPLGAPAVAPRLAGRPQIADAVVEAEGAVLPELEARRHDAETRPVRRPRHLAEAELDAELRHRLLERDAAFARARLLLGP